MKRNLLAVVVALALIAAGLGIYGYSGLYNIGADAPHWPWVYRIMQTVRERSIRAHARNLQSPNLDDPRRISEGAGHYSAMCTGCHLAPGMETSEIRPGLYPRPPNLSRVRVDPRDAFWTIKHGIKMSAMPAWGDSHDDDTIWAMVAFIEKLPDMTPQQYKDIVAKAPPDEDAPEKH